MAMTKNERKFLPNWRSSTISSHATIKDAMQAISRSGAFMACIVSQDGVLEAIMTDSDVRRAFLQGAKISDGVTNWKQKNPVVAKENCSPGELIALAEANSVREIPLIDQNGCLVDIFILLNHQDRVALDPSQEASMVTATNLETLPNHMLILAGGLGTRLRSVVSDRPKPLAMVGDRPILETLMLRAAASGIRNFYVAVNYMADLIIDFLSHKRFENLNIHIVRETQRLGTAGAIGLIKDEIRHPLLVCNADVLTTAPFHKIIQHHKNENADITCSVRPHEYTVPYGVVDIAHGRITSLREKPSTSYLVNAGIYLLNQDICSMVKMNQYLDMTDLITNAVQAGKHVAPFLLHEYWVDIGKPEDFSRANNEFQSFFGDI